MKILTKNKILLMKIYSDILDSSKKEPRWNFWKHLVNPEGQVVKSWRPEEPIEVIRPEIAALIRQMIIKKKEDLRNAIEPVYGNRIQNVSMRFDPL